MSIPTPPKGKKFTCVTYIPSRSPQWKSHTNIGQAKNAVMYMRRECWVYKVLDNGEPEFLWHITPEMYDLPNHAGMPWKDTEAEVEKDRQQKIASLRKRISSYIQAAEKLVIELQELEKDEPARHYDGGK